MTEMKAACRLYKAQNGSITIYIKKELAKHIKLLELTDLYAKYDTETNTLTIGEM